MKPRTLLGLALISAMVLLLIVPGARYLNMESVLPGTLPYHQLHMVEIQGLEQDPLIARPVLFQPYTLLLSLLGGLIGLYLASVILPLLLGLLSVVGLFAFLRKLKLDIDTIGLILFLFIVSPLFIFLFGVSQPGGLVVALLIMGVLCFSYGKNYTYLGAFLLACIPFVSASAGVFAILLLVVYVRRSKGTFLWILPLVGTLLVTQAYRLLLYGFPHQGPFEPLLILTHLISDLGSTMGFGFFHLTLAAIGLYALWNQYKPLAAYTLLFVVFLSSFYFTELNLYLHIVVAFVGGFGLIKLIRTKWEIDLIKTLTIILVICSVLFSTVSYLNRLSEADPSPSVVQSLEWLGGYSDPGEVVLSHRSKGSWIETISNRPVLLDSHFSYVDSFGERFSDSETLFSSRNLETTGYLLRKYNISYIWIDKDMQEGLVWSKEDEGLLFLFRNDQFTKIYDKEGVAIWRFQPS